MIGNNLYRNIFCSLAILLLSKTFAQSPYHITHIEGTKLINGISVTVTHKGKIAILDDLSYCDGETGPYYFGYDNKTTFKSGFGSYTFQFSPAVTEVTINFTGLSAEEGLMEEMKVFINGSHYAIPSVGSKINCEEMAILTSKGNIRPCKGCSVSGWKGTKIKGPITTLTVSDTVFAGDPAGVLIALYIGNPIEEDYTIYTSTNKVRIGDVAAGKSLVIQSTQLVNNTYSLSDELGNKLTIDYQMLDNEHILINTHQLKIGNYTLEIKGEENTEKHKIIIE